MNKRKVSGKNNYPKKNSLVESKNLERALAEEISKELSKIKQNNKKKQ